MVNETSYRLAFLILFVTFFVMRAYFMIKIHRAKQRLMPDKEAGEREGGSGYVIFRVVLFVALVVFLGMYLFRMAWIDVFNFVIPGWLRWAGFALGILSVLFMTWTQVSLDIQWSAQLQLREDHRLITTGPYSRMRHPLYTSLFGWSAAVSLLTANWIFVAISLFAMIGMIIRIPKEGLMMIEAFGDEYKAFMKRSGRFLPKL
jgi:protein-S-isoprenylcysteine O-methyltransferase Ste14